MNGTDGGATNCTTAVPGSNPGRGEHGDPDSTGQQATDNTDNTGFKRQFKN